MRRARGAVLLPVAVAIALIGVIAYFIANQSATNLEMAANDFEAAQVEYVAQAGMEHALRELSQQGCGPHTNLVSVSFGNDQYDTALSTDLGGTTSYTINVDQDSWIRSDQPTINKGVDLKLHTRNEIAGTERPLLRYDLSPLAANAPILSATAWFYITNAHAAGPIDIHLTSADWTETGATWNSMSANMNSAVLATIPSQPVADKWIAVNLTAQVQAWVNGEPNFGITLNSTVDGVHGQYNSRESANPPYLEVVEGSPPSSPAELKSVGTLANGVSETISRNDVVLYQHPLGRLRLQPDAVDGEDTEIWDQAPNNNYGATVETWVSSAATDTTRSLLRFNMGSIPVAARILEANLLLERQSGSGADQPVSAHRIRNSWSEASVTWNQREPGTNWDTAGGDFDATAITTTLVGPANQRYAWNITPLVQGWVDGSNPNYGVALVAAIAGMPGEQFYTSDHADPSKWPSLSVTYSCQCGSVCVAPQGLGRIALIGDDNSPDPDDQLKIAIIESWGYQVDFYEDQDSDSINWNNYDLVYISETSVSGDLDSGIKDAPIGVINEEPNFHDDLELGDGYQEHVGSSLDIADNSHYITMPFALGTLSIYTEDMEILTVDNLAPDMQMLANFGGNGSLTVLELGAQTSGGNNVPGRRVIMPLGQHFASGFDWRHLNSNGRLIVQRAIEWGMNKSASASGGPGIWISTENDVSGSGAPGLDDWVDGEALSISHPNLAFEPGTTDGTFSSVINLDDFTGNADIDALHFVGSSITVGGANSVDLQYGDLLLSTTDNETLTSTNSISINDEDVFVFRPDVAGDYSAGTFIFLLDGSQVHPENDTVAVSLVEKDTAVGDGNMAQGDFIIAISNFREVIAVRVFDVGLGTTSVNPGSLVDGNDIGFGSEIRGLDLTEDEITLGGHTLSQGSVLVTLDNDDGGVGDNNISADAVDIFYLTVTQVGTNTIADATLLLEGNDVNLDSGEEHLQALTLAGISLGTSTTLEIPIIHVDDDVEQLLADGDMYMDSSDLELALDAGTSDVVGMRFQGVTVGSGASIFRAYIQFTVDETNTGGTNLQIHGEAIDNAPIFNNTDYNLSNRIETAASVNWSPPDWNTVGEAGPDQRTADITSILQEIIDRPGWSYGNSLVIKVSGPDTRTAVSYDGDPAEAPVLHIEYVGGADGGPIAHWKLDEGGGPTAIDSVGGNDATLNGNPVWTLGPLDGALAFDGSGDYATTATSFTPPPVATVSFWMKVPGSPAAQGRILGLGDTWEIRHVTTGTADGIPYGLVFDLGVSGVNTEFVTTVTVDIPDQWYYVVATYDTGSDAYGVYLDGVLHKSGTYPSALTVPAGNPISLGTRTGTSDYFDGTLDDVRIYDRVLSASEISDLFAEGTPPGAASYTETHQPWSASNNDVWQTFDLSGFGVPADAVVEVAVINNRTGNERWGGVRAVGSSLDRRFRLHESEGGGVDSVVMHVQADASGQIQHYADNITDLTFILLGYWEGASYVELFGTFTVGSGAWMAEDVSDEGLGANQIAEIVIVNSNTGAERMGGVRAMGSSNDRRFDLHEAESNGMDTASMMVATDSSSQVEAYAESGGADITFYVVGYWSTPPGTYTEIGGSFGQVSAASSWQSTDLTSFGVPADAVAQFVISNESDNSENNMGVRATGSTDNRVIDLQEAESGGADLATMHANVDGSVRVEWFAESGTTDRYFYPVGWWVLSP